MLSAASSHVSADESASCSRFIKQMEATETGRGMNAAGYLDRLAGWAKRREYTAAALLFTLILLGFFYPFLLGKQVSQQHILWSEWPWKAFTPTEMNAPILANEGDEAHTFHPLGAAARTSIRNGEIPLWNPYSYGGHVMLGDQQTALLFPITWVGVILPLASAWGLMLILKLLMAAMGVYLYARGVGIRRGGALVAGTVFMLSAPMLGWLQWPHSTVFALVGWLFLATDRLTRSGSWKDFGWVSLAVAASILAGHPESAILNSLAAFAYAAAVIAADRTRRSSALVGVRKLGMYLASQPMGLLAAGAAVMPFYEAYVRSIEKSAHKYQATSWLDPWDILLYFMPDLFGRPGNWPPVARLDFLFTSTLVDFGVGALILAGIGFVRLRARAETKGLAAVGLLSVILMFDIFPADLLMKIPPLNTVIVQRVYVYIALVGAVMAGAAAVSLVDTPMTVKRVVRWTVIPFVLAVGFLWFELAVGVSYGPKSVVNYSAITRLAAGLGLTAVILTLCGRVKERYAFAAVLAACVMQLSYHVDLNIWLPADQAHPPTPPSLAYLQREQHVPGQFRVGTIRSGVELTLIQSNALAQYGLESLEGHDPPIARRWVTFATGPLSQPGYLERLPGGPDPRDPKALVVLRAMNVRYYITRPYANYSIPGLREVYRGPDAVIYRDLLALPRSYVVPTGLGSGPMVALKAMRTGTFNPKEVAYVPPGVRRPVGIPGAYRPAKSKWLSNRQIQVSVPNGAAGWLVVGNAWTPEWKATVDGKEATVYPTNFAMQGLPLGPGRHTVVLTYSASGFWLGVLMSVAGFGLIALMIIGGRRGWKPRRRIEERLGRTLPIPAWAVGPGDELDESQLEPAPASKAVSGAVSNATAAAKAALSKVPRRPS